MAHTRLLDQLLRTLRLAHDCEEAGVSTAEGLARRDEAEARATRERRDFLSSLGALAATGAVATLSTACGAGDEAHGDALGRGAQAASAPSLDVGIVGAGLAGLVCADQLRQGGVTAALYEASDRVGGRQRSLAGKFPGQVVELGGELIDTSQKHMIDYARTFGLTLEDYLKSPGETAYWIDGRAVPESDVVDAFRAFVPAMKDDLRQVSAAPSVDAHNEFDVVIDSMSIADYLASRGASQLLRSVVSAAYVGEYGLEITEQSALCFLLYVRADRRAKFQPFGTSDQRYHVVEGNDGIAKGLAERVAAQLRFGMALTRVRKTATGRIELTFRNGAVRTHDVVVLAMPFSVLRTLDLDASLALPVWKSKVIRELGYGTNAKNMVGFAGRPWAAQGSNGMAYATLPNLQNAWETSWTTATTSSAVMTNFTGGVLGASQDPAKIQGQTAAFLVDLDVVYPGASAVATREASGAYRAVMTAWSREPWALGSYTCYRPGQFTSLCGNEAKPVGNLYFAGEHCDSWYNQQGFMEGALTNGIATAATLLALAKKG
jgi:monoamine oxidase